ncbi:hypothetical protein VTN77DRAFT_8707 [Rasamsonia byssochlamydoides]|uniref:uncharacterized protein n=1 Tax=Rasamsonia byssochlamydoides TaxID=89139 RepID=UPI003741F2E4
MISDFLTSSYLQYKADTNAVASWLATTAKKCGYAPDLLTGNSGKQQQQQQPSGRLKGRARKEAREAAKRSQGGSTTSIKPPGQLPTYTIAIKDFISLAEYIASYRRPPVRVPASFVTALNRAIEVRREHGIQLSSHLPEISKKQAADERHNYFIEVLECVREVLRPRMPSELLADSLSEPSGDQPASVMDRLSNKFDRLELYEPSEQFLQAPDVTPATDTATPPDANYEAERLQDVEEAFLSFQLLLHDLNKFRNVISQTWAGYRQGLFDLVSASLMTNTAIDIARRMEEDLQPTLEKHGGAERMLQVFFLALCMEHGEDQGYREQPGDDMNFRMYNAAEAIFCNTYQLLSAFSRLVDDWHIPEYKPGFYGKYDPFSDRSKKTAREKYQEDKIVLLEILPEFSVLCKGTDRVPAEDELTRGLRMMFKTHKIPLWLVFAAQVFLDIHHVLREDIDRGFSDLCTSASLISASIEETLKFHAKLRVETWPPSNDRVLRDILDRINGLVNTDPIQKAKRRLGRSAGEPFKLMKQHPVFCGLWAYSLKALFQEVGVVFAGAWGSIMYTAHLYNAVRQEKLLHRPWKDMELVSGLQEANIFVGSRPKTPEDYLKRFALSMGYSASSFARNKRGGPLEASKTGPKGMVELAPVAQMFKARYCHGSGQTELTRQDLEKILAKSNWETEKWELEPKNGAPKPGDDFVVLSRNEAAARKRWQDHRQLSATQLLESLRNALQGETLEFNFDYLMMHRFCWRLLRQLREDCDQGLRNIYGPGYLERENQLPFTVGYIFMAATNTQRLGNQLFKNVKKNSTVVTSALLEQAAKTIDTMIQSGAGSFVCDKVLRDQYNLWFELEEEDNNNYGKEEAVSF